MRMSFLAARTSTVLTGACGGASPTVTGGGAFGPAGEVCCRTTGRNCDAEHGKTRGLHDLTFCD